MKNSCKLTTLITESLNEGINDRKNGVPLLNRWGSCSLFHPVSCVEGSDSNIHRGKEREEIQTTAVPFRKKWYYELYKDKHTHKTVADIKRGRLLGIF